MDAKLTPDRARNEGGGGGEESNRFAKIIRTGNVVAKVISVVGAVGQVERLRHQLNVHPVADLDVLCQLGIEFEDRKSAQRIELRDGAIPCQVVAILRANVISGESKIVLSDRSWGRLQHWSFRLQH